MVDNIFWIQINNLLYSAKPYVLHLSDKLIQPSLKPLINKRNGIPCQLKSQYFGYYRLYILLQNTFPMWQLSRYMFVSMYMNECMFPFIPESEQWIISLHKVTEPLKFESKFKLFFFPVKLKIKIFKYKRSRIDKTFLKNKVEKPTVLTLETYKVLVIKTVW